MKRLYLALAVVGFIVPYYFFVYFLLENGFDVRLIIQSLFSNLISIFFTTNLIITALVFLIFSYREAKLARVSHWRVYLVGTLLVGPSFTYPLFLYAREV